jgi:membrane protease YdiL (CAAX protease family)
VTSKTSVDKRFVIGAGISVLGYSAVLNRVLPPRVHVPANLIAAALATWIVRRDGASWDDLGLSPSRLPDGVRAGIAVAVPIVAATAALAAAPQTRRHFEDTRVLEAPNPWYELALRIPVGTALCEEVLFRSALLAGFERHSSRRAAIVISSALFGLWHVLPTLEARRANADQATMNAEADPRLLVLGTIGATGIAGFAFATLRRRTGSVVAAVIAHSAVNVSGFIAARMNQRRFGRTRPGR